MDQVGKSSSNLSSIKTACAVDAAESDVKSFTGGALFDPAVLEQEFLRAFINSDYERLNSLLSEQFTHTTFIGRQLNRHEFLEAHRLEVRQIHRAEITERLSQDVRGVTIVTGLIDLFARFDGFTYKGPMRFTWAWALFEDGWKVLTLHTSDARQISAWDKLSVRYENPRSL